MPQAMKGYISTSRLAKFLQIDREDLLNYLHEKSILKRDTATNKYKLTDLGTSKGGKDQSSDGSSKYIIWQNDFINDEIFDNYEYDVMQKNNILKSTQTNMWKDNDLKILKEYIYDGKSIDEMALRLSMSEEAVIRKINSLPRLKKKYTTNNMLNYDKEEHNMLTNEEIINYLAQGINPITGEMVANDNVLNEPDIIRALFAAHEAMCNQSNKKANKQSKEKKTVQEKQDENITNDLPRNAGLPWTEELKLELHSEFEKYKSITKLAEIFERTKGSITSALIRLEIITPEDKLSNKYR